MNWSIPKVEYVAAPSEKNMCVLACLAMVTGTTLETVLKNMEQFWKNEGQHQGTGEEPFYQYLAVRGYAVQHIAHDYIPGDKLLEPWPPSPWAPIHTADVYHDGPHAVVVLHDGKVLDPNDTERSRLDQYHRVYAIQGIWYAGAKPSLNIPPRG
jgi:hypothetical protein